MIAPRPTLPGWVIAVLCASCGTAGLPESDAPASRSPICGVDERLRQSLPSKDENVSPSELVLRVVDHANERPMAGLSLRLRGARELLGNLDCVVQTDRYGVAHARLLSALYQVSVVERRELVVRTGSFYVGGSGPRELRVERAGAISGRVLDEGGKPMPLANITISGEDGLCGGETDAAGAFRCEGLWSGEHQVTASHEDRAPATRMVMLHAGQDLRGVDLTILPGGVLIVRATCGGPCVGAVVSASVGDEVREELVGPDGIARLRDLPSGEAQVYGFRDDPRGGRLRGKALGVRVQAGRTVNATLDLGRRRN